MNVHRIIKVEGTKKYSGYDYTRDGEYDKPRVKKEDKKGRQRLMRRLNKQLGKLEIKEFLSK